LSQEHVNIINKSIVSNEIEAVIKSIPKTKSPRPNGFTAKFYQTIKELTPILLKLFHKIEMEGTLPNSSYKFSISLIPKVDKDIKKTIDQLPQ
jgi:hypothetical protein